MKVQFVTTTTVKGGRIRATSIDGYTKPQLAELDEEQPIANSLKPVVNGYVRDRIVAEGGSQEATVRSRVTYLRKNAQLSIEVKILGVEAPV